jgi:hypothetical protein
MIAILLGVTIPIVYVVGGAAIGFRLRNSKIGCGNSSYSVCPFKEPGDRHKDMCDNAPASVLGGIFWPLIPLIWLGYRIGTRKRIFGFRARRAERVAKNIARMEKEIWGEAFDG